MFIYLSYIKVYIQTLWQLFYILISNHLFFWQMIFQFIRTIFLSATILQLLLFHFQVAN